MDEKEEDISAQEIDTVRLRHRPLTPEWLEEVFRVRAQVLKDANGYIFEDSVVAVRREREKRTKALMQTVSGQHDKDPYAEDTGEEQAEDGF